MAYTRVVVKVPELEVSDMILGHVCRVKDWDPSECECDYDLDEQEYVVKGPEEEDYLDEEE